MPQFGPRQTKRAQELRNNATEAEQRLWGRLRRRQLAGFKFSRQMSVGPFVCDFLCRERGLVVELDGGQHADPEAQDTKRTAYLNAQGMIVLRFWNNDVLENMDGVLQTILAKLEDLQAKFELPSPTACGRGRAAEPRRGGNDRDSLHNGPTPRSPPASGRGLL